MWANHDWYDIQPAKMAGNLLQFAGAIGLEPFEAMVDRLLELFQHPSYLLVDGCPYFSISTTVQVCPGYRRCAASSACRKEERRKFVIS